MRRRYRQLLEELRIGTPDQIALKAVDNVVSLEEAAALFSEYDWGEDVAYVITGAEVVERLAYDPPSDPKERAELEEKVRAFFWNWLESATDPERDKWNPTKSYPL